MADADAARIGGAVVREQTLLRHVVSGTAGKTPGMSVSSPPPAHSAGKLALYGAALSGGMT